METNQKSQATNLTNLNISIFPKQKKSHVLNNNPDKSQFIIHFASSKVEKIKRFKQQTLQILIYHVILQNINFYLFQILNLLSQLPETKTNVFNMQIFQIFSIFVNKKDFIMYCLYTTKGVKKKGKWPIFPLQMEDMTATHETDDSFSYRASYCRLLTNLWQLLNAYHKANLSRLC